MADHPTEKKETAKKDEAYQPLWDTDQSIPEYMALLMDQQASEQEDAELHEASDSEDSDGSNEPEDTSEDTHENEVENHPVALASAQPTQSAGSAGSAQPVLSARERAQAMQTQATQTQTMHAYGEYVRLESLGLSPGAILPVIPDPLFGTPDSKLIEMRLLDRSQDESAPMQACAAHLNPVKNEENPTSRAAMIQPVGYVYYLVYNRLPDGYTGVNGFTKEEEDSFSVYEFLKKQEHAKLHEAAAQREAAALQKPAAHPALADEEKQD